jgi:tRNA U34 5-methylaminomethyl-2-thiouridine-forming methyltransferase MnmC
MTNELFLTQDGSHSLLSSEFGVSYHSKYGAIGESQHIFIDAGLDFYLNQHDMKPVRIFEMGFGTGLNALMTYKESLQKEIEKEIKIDYHTIEKQPISSDTLSKLNYLSALEINEHSSAFEQMHKSPSREEVKLSEHFRFTKIIGNLKEEKLPQKVDVIYFDAFAPNSQPELWDDTIMHKLYSILNDNGILVTYCAKGSFKRTLKAVGFKLDSIPGPHGKREMTRAIKIL